MQDTNKPDLEEQLRRLANYVEFQALDIAPKLLDRQWLRGPADFLSAARVLRDCCNWIAAEVRENSK